jgi:hypothetical protein
MFGWMRRFLWGKPAEKPTPKPEPEWFGRFLSPDEIVDDMVKHIISNPEIVKIWCDPESFTLAGLFEPGRKWKTDPNPNAGRLAFVPMNIRNWYGLWREDCPYTEIKVPVVENGIITDPRFPDNLSGKIIEDVKKRVVAFKEALPT